MKYAKPDWPVLLTALMESRGMRQVDMSKKLEMKSQSIHGLLNRTEHKWPTLQRLSRLLGEDLVVHCLSLETQEVLQKAKAVGIEPGEGNPLLDWIEEKARLEDELVGKTASLDRLTAEVERLGPEKDFLANENERLRKEIERLQGENDQKTARSEQQQANEEGLELKLRELQKRFDALEEKARSEQKAREAEIRQLKEEKKESEYESRLKISVLEAKLEVLQAK